MGESEETRAKNRQYFHNGDDVNFSQLKETGVGGDIRREAIMVDGVGGEDTIGSSTLHRWADRIAIENDELRRALEAEGLRVGPPLDLDVVKNMPNI